MEAPAQTWNLLISIGGGTLNEGSNRTGKDLDSSALRVHQIRLVGSNSLSWDLGNTPS